MKRSNTLSTLTKSSHGFKLLLVTLCCLLFSVTTKAQLSGLNFEDAINLKPGQYEFVLDMNVNYMTYSGQTYKSFNCYGTFMRIGVHQQIDLKISYNRLSWDTWSDGLNLVQISPKFSSKNGVIALRLPFGVLFEKNDYVSEGEKKYNTSCVVSPKLIITPVQKKIFRLNLVPMSEFLFSKGSPGMTLIGMDVGLGFSSNFDKWSIRPEGGAVVPIGDNNGFIWHVGLSGSIILGSK